MSSRAYAARRPAPRRVRRRVGPSRVRWDRIGRIALVLVLFAVLASYLNPAVNLFDAWRDSKAGEQRLLELRSENADLGAQVERASDPLTMEREARKLGMVKPGRARLRDRGLGRLSGAFVALSGYFRGYDPPRARGRHACALFCVMSR